MSLVIWECRRIARLIVFWLVLFTLLVAVISQVGQDYQLVKPQPGDTSYGTKLVDDYPVAYRQAMLDLIDQTNQNRFETYPMGFYRLIQLEPEELDYLNQVIEQVTGLSVTEQRQLATAELGQRLDQQAKQVPRADFEQALQRINSILGGGSNFSQSNYRGYYERVPRTYEDALAEYQQIVAKGYSASFARLLSDYTSIFVLLLSGFIPLALWYKDRRRALADVIYVRQVSTSRLFWSRYLATTIMTFVGVGLLIGYYQFKLIQTYGWSQTDPLGLFITCVYWLIPTILVGGAFASLVTIITQSPLAAPLQILLWYLVVLQGGSGLLYGDYGWKLVPRHNTFGNEQFFLDHWSELAWNRVGWAVIGLLLAVASQWWLQKRREGNYGPYRRVH